MNNPAINIHVKVFALTYFQFSWVYIPRNAIANYLLISKSVLRSDSLGYPPQCKQLSTDLSTPPSLKHLQSSESTRINYNFFPIKLRTGQFSQFRSYSRCLIYIYISTYWHCTMATNEKMMIYSLDRYLNIYCMLFTVLSVGNK